MEKLSTSELMYLAGFFDGEGSVGIYTRGKVFPMMSMTVVQNSSPAADAMFTRWASVLGGSIARNLSQSGRVKLQWQAGGATAATILKQIVPYLVFKREQVELCLRWDDLRSGPRRGPDGRLLPSDRTPEHDYLIRRVKELKREPMQLLPAGK